MNDFLLNPKDYFVGLSFEEKDGMYCPIISYHVITKHDGTLPDVFGVQKNPVHCHECYARQFFQGCIRECLTSEWIYHVFTANIAYGLGKFYSIDIKTLDITEVSMEKRDNVRKNFLKIVK